MLNVAVHHALVCVSVVCLRAQGAIVHEDRMELLALRTSYISKRRVHQALEDARALLGPEKEDEWAQHTPARHQREDLLRFRREFNLSEPPNTIQLSM